MTSDTLPPEDKNSDTESIIALDTRTIGKATLGVGGVVTEKHLLYFGSNVLLALAVLMCLSAAVYFWSDEHHLQTGKEIFEFAKATFPPIATLILGFYFRGARGPNKDTS